MSMDEGFRPGTIAEMRARTGREPSGPKRPWYWFVVLGLIAAAASCLTAWNTAGRVQGDREHFVNAEKLRVQQMKYEIDDLFGDMQQLCGVGAAIYGGAGANRALVRRLTHELYSSRMNRVIYGAGGFFEPGAAGKQTTLFSDYFRVVDPRLHFRADVGVGSQGVVEALHQSDLRGDADDYTRMPWYSVGLRSFGRTRFIGPYVDHGRGFISAERAIVRQGRAVGVVSVDTLSTGVLAIVSRHLAPGDVAWMDSGSTTRPILQTGDVPANRGRIVRALALRYAPDKGIVISSDARPLESAAGSSILAGGTVIALIWIGVVVVAIGLCQRWRAQDRRRQDSAEKTELEYQIHLSQTVEGALRKAALTDVLTGLPNRRAFLEHAQSVIELGATSPQAVFFIDLDRFNIVNETLGHSAGDDLLRAIGTRLRATLAQDDMIARLGGDEFVVLAHLEMGKPIDEMAGALLSCLGEPVVLQGRSIYPEASIGVVALDPSFASAEDILRDADIAMYEAKRRGRAQHVVFDADMRRAVAEDSEFEDTLRRAIDRGDLVTYYQPVVSMYTRGIIGFEALVRWNRSGVIVGAYEFVPFAEKHGLIGALDMHVLDEVVRHSRIILDLFPGAKISVNISASELATAGLAETIAAMRDTHQCELDWLKLEITETTMMTSSEVARRTIEQLRSIGVSFALDDFGTGYSSLAYLQGLPISEVKIDRSFVALLPYDQRAVEIVRSIALLVRSLGLLSTAEGVESIEQFELLAELGVDCAQGFFFSPAIDIASLFRLQARTVSSRPARE
jgi:diguanylate cyclase (GGDEF)-like protein